jgi:hypothetical protein
VLPFSVEDGKSSEPLVGSYIESPLYLEWNPRLLAGDNSQADLIGEGIGHAEATFRQDAEGRSVKRIKTALRS